MKRKLGVDMLCTQDNYHADVVELVDTLALGASASGREGSSPFIRTNENTGPCGRYFRWLSVARGLGPSRKFCLQNFDAKGRIGSEVKESAEGIFLSERTEEALADSPFLPTPPSPFIERKPYSLHQVRHVYYAHAFICIFVLLCYRHTAQGARYHQNVHRHSYTVHR